MSINRKFKVEKITDTVTDKAGEEESQMKRTVTLNAEGNLSLVLTGYPGELNGFVTGDVVEVDLKTSQTKLQVDEE